MVDFRGSAAKTPITAAMLAAKLGDGAALRDGWCLLATGWGQKRAKTQEWLRESPVLAADGARWLVEKQARGVGIDHWTIGDATTHSILLSKPVLIVEELFFADEVFALKGPQEFWALPLRLKAHSGGPCRPVLVV